MRNKLVITQENNGRFLCIEEDAIGACIQGRGSSVLEAVGSWVIYSQVVNIRCDPPAVLNEFSITNDYTDLIFLKSPERD